MAKPEVAKCEICGSRHLAWRQDPPGIEDTDLYCLDCGHPQLRSDNLAFAIAVELAEQYPEVFDNDDIIIDFFEVLYIISPAYLYSDINDK